jgi:putative DNA primase/helicase
MRPSFFGFITVFNMANKLADRCKGRWRDIIGQLGLLDLKALDGKDSPCPMCGGVDRFRFYRGPDQSYGRWYCRGCYEGGDGIKLVMRITGLDFKGAAKVIESVIGESGWTPPNTINGVGADKPRDPLKAWREGQPIVEGCAAYAYLAGRSVAPTAVEAASLRFHPALFHWPTQAKWPAMIAAVGPYGAPAVTCHQTFVEFDGSDKAPIEKPKLFPAGASPRGCGVWFNIADIEHGLVVCEGVESTLSAMRLYGLPAGVAALSDNGIRFLDLPPMPLASRIRVFADHDELGQGLAAAKDAARRWIVEGRAVTVSMASEAGEDANDVWARRLKAQKEAAA